MSYHKITESEYGDSPNNYHIHRDYSTINVTLTYPLRDNSQEKTIKGCRYIFVNQESVRASDGVRLHYDYERDGWVIEQASRFSWTEKEVDAAEAKCLPLDSDWQEVAFVRSWGRDTEK